MKRTGKKAEWKRQTEGRHRVHAFQQKTTVRADIAEMCARGQLPLKLLFHFTFMQFEEADYATWAGAISRSRGKFHERELFDFVPWASK